MISNKTWCQSIVLSLASGTAFAASVPNRVLVKFKPGASRFQTLADPSLLGAQSLVLATKNFSALRYATDLSPRAAAAALMRRSDVEWAQPDYILSILPMPELAEARLPGALDSVLNLGREVFAVDENAASDAAAKKPDPILAPTLPTPLQLDPMLTEAWGLDSIKASAAWELQRGSHDILVADIDTGVDYTHEDLVNNLAPGIGYDFMANDALPFDDNEHGTHTAGTIGAVGGNGKGIAGVSPVASIMALRFLGGADGHGTTSDAIRAIDYAIEHHARVINASWGGPAGGDAGEDKAMVEAIQRTGQANILFVAAAGNDGTNNDNQPMYPAAIQEPNILAVAATGNSDTLAFFSNYGVKTVHVAAPGFGVLSSVPGNQYRKLAGTSMACPHVVGVAALVLAERPSLTAVQVKEIIMSTVDAVPGLEGKVSTGGRVNALAAVTKARGFVAR